MSKRNVVPPSAFRLNSRQRSLGLLIAFAAAAFLYWRWDHISSPKAMASKIELPPDLEQVVLRQFDELALRKELLYAPSVPEHFEHQGFRFEVRVTPILKEKPILPPGDPGRSNAGGPFIDPVPSEVVTAVGPDHRLLINKFCVYRPMLVLPTIEYAKQTSDLDGTDIAAVWAVMNGLSTEQIAIYNCGGINAGSSQGHKHMQIMPIPSPATYTLWPSSATSPDAITSNIPNVPFKHYVLQLLPNASPEHVYEQYKRLLHETIAALQEAHEEPGYNVAITSKWIAVIPRSKAEWGGPYGANTLGMLGLVSIRDAEEKSQWAKLGWTMYLRELGIALDS